MANLIDQIKQRKWLVHLLIFLGFILVTAVYMPDAFQNKLVIQGDGVQSRAAKEDVLAYHKLKGVYSPWTNRNFGGMPLHQGYGVYSSNLPKTFLNTFPGTIFQAQAYQLIFACLCVYLGLLALGFRPWMAAIGALAFAFGTDHLVLLDAGHATKAKTMAMALPILAGVHLLFRKKWLSGLLMVSVFLAFQIAANHLQITYYTMLLVLVMGVVETIRLIRAKKFPELGKGIGLGFAALLIALLPNISFLWATWSYAKETVRGERILESVGEDAKEKGLAYDYANVFSYGIDETLTLIVPGYMGGSDNEWLSSSSESYETIKRTGLNAPRISGKEVVMPLFWGDRPVNSGPVYYGAVLVFLFLALFSFIPKGQRWFLLSGLALILLIAWGRNMGFLNEFMFDVLPFFDRFRSPAMILGMGSLLVIWGVLSGFEGLLRSEEDGKQKARFIRNLLIGSGGFLIVLYLLAPVLYTFDWSYGLETISVSMDQQLRQNLMSTGAPANVVDSFMEALRADRLAYMRSDILRTLLLFVLAGGLLWAFFLKKLPRKYLIPALAVLIIADLFFVGKRYLNAKDFTPADKLQSRFVLTESDLSLYQMRSPHDRMVDLTRSIWQDARPNYWHANIGGNHGAKLRRFQDLIDNHLNRELDPLLSGQRTAQLPVLNMLDVRLFKTGTGPKNFLDNITAQGFAWMPQEILWVDSPNAELDSLSSLSRTTRVILHEEFRPYMEGFQPSQLNFGKIELRRYAPGEVDYRISLDSEQLVVFSEIWYKGDEVWKVKLDGEPVSHIRANYILRAMRVPAGVHDISFRYEPPAFSEGATWSWIGSVLLILVIIAVPVYSFWRRRKGTEA